MPKRVRYRGHPLAYLISIGIFVVVAIGAILLTRGYTIDVHSGALKKTGLLVLGSDPKDAYITIDHDVEDVRTRSRLTLIPGSYNVTVDLPDTHPWEKRISIEPGEAVIEEDILLFLDQPDRIALSEAPVNGAALDATARRVAYLQPVPDGVGLFVRNTDGQDPAKQITLLPAGYASPTSLTWSNDGNRIAASVAGESRIVSVDSGTTATVPVGGRTALAPGQSDVLLAEPSAGALVRVQSDGTVEPLETDVRTWTVSTDAAYIGKTDGSVIRRVRNDSRSLQSGPLQTELIAAPGSDRVFGRTADGLVTRFDSDTPKPVTDGAAQLSPGRGGEQIAYVRQRELRLWNDEDRTDDLLSRFTEVPGQLGVLPGGTYALFGNGSSISAIAADGSNTTELTATDGLLGVIDREHLLVRDQSGTLLSLGIIGR